MAAWVGCFLACSGQRSRCSSWRPWPAEVAVGRTMTMAWEEAYWLALSASFLALFGIWTTLISSSFDVEFSCRVANWWRMGIVWQMSQVQRRHRLDLAGSSSTDWSPDSQDILSSFSIDSRLFLVNCHGDMVIPLHALVSTVSILLLWIKRELVDYLLLGNRKPILWSVHQQFEKVSISNSWSKRNYR